MKLMIRVTDAPKELMPLKPPGGAAFLREQQKPVQQTDKRMDHDTSTGQTNAGIK